MSELNYCGGCGAEMESLDKYCHGCEDIFNPQIRMGWLVYSNGEENCSPLGYFRSEKEAKVAIYLYYANGGSHDDPYACMVSKEVQLPEHQNYEKTPIPKVGDIVELRHRYRDKWVRIPVTSVEESHFIMEMQPTVETYYFRGLASKQPKWRSCHE